MAFGLLHIIFFVNIWLNSFHNTFAVSPLSTKSIKIVTGNGILNQENEIHLHIPKAEAVDLLDANNQIPSYVGDWIICPITKKIMNDPVITIGDGHTYERDAIEFWFKKGYTISPMTGNTLSTTQIISNLAIYQSIQQILINEPTLKIHQYHQKSYGIIESMINKKEKELNLVSDVEKSHDNSLSQVEIFQDPYQTGNIEILEKINLNEEQQNRISTENVNEEIKNDEPIKLEEKDTKLKKKEGKSEKANKKGKKKEKESQKDEKINDKEYETSPILNPSDILTGVDDIEMEKLLMVSVRNSITFKKYQYPNGDIFEGNFQNNKQEGYGKFYFANGQTYEGFFQKGMRQGFGIYTWSDGGKYEGFWKDDKRHGKGIYTDPSGHSTEGEYVNDKRQCQLNWQRVEF